MIVQITNRCHMGCSHCMVESEPDGIDMSEEVFDNFIKFARDYALGLPSLQSSPILVSGGEPTEHLKCLDYCRRLLDAGFYVTLLSNGTFVYNDELYSQIRDMLINEMFLVQVTSDSRFYPQSIDLEKLAELRITVETKIRCVDPVGRGKVTFPDGINARKYPQCFNYRCNVDKFGSFKEMREFFVMRGKFCFPRVNPMGDIYSGEHNLCKSIGNVRDGVERVFDNLKGLRCDNCGLSKNLPLPHSLLWQR